MDTAAPTRRKTAIASSWNKTTDNLLPNNYYEPSAGICKREI